MYMPEITPGLVKLVESGFTRNIEIDPRKELQAQGFSPLTRQLSAVQQVRLHEAARLWEEFTNGRIPPYLMEQALHISDDFAYNDLRRRAPHIFHESMTSSDFGHLSDNLMYQALAGQWEFAPRTYDAVAKIRRNIADFRKLRSYFMEGMEDTWDKIGEREGFKRVSATQTNREYSVAKYAKGFDMNWEMVVQDNINAFRDFPERIIRGGINTLERFATEMYIDANGPHATFFSSGNANILANNPPLSIEAFAAALAHFLNLQNSSGTPIAINGVNLVVTSGDQLVVANNIKNAVQVEMTKDGLTGNGSAIGQRLLVNNWLANNFNIIFNPWGRIICTASGVNPWFVFANPSNGRHALEMGFLQGYDSPVMYRRAPNAMRLGGGLDETHGDFETMAHSYKGLMVFGGMQNDPKAALASFGNGQA